MQIQSKFDPGQKVWINRIPYFRGELLPLRQEEAEIACIEIWRSGKPLYFLSVGLKRAENEVHLTKEEAVANSKQYERKIYDIYYKGA